MTTTPNIAKEKYIRRKNNRIIAEKLEFHTAKGKRILRNHKNTCLIIYYDYVKRCLSLQSMRGLRNLLIHC